MMSSLSEPIHYTAFKGSRSGSIVKAELIKENLGPQDVLLENLYSGLCGTDVHYSHDDLVIGHEGVGIVKAVGQDVKSLKL